LDRWEVVERNAEVLGSSFSLSESSDFLDLSEAREQTLALLAVGGQVFAGDCISL
jgi:hypothetical protein